MWFVVAIGTLVVFSAGISLAVRLRKTLDLRHRGDAEYPTTANDPTGRIVI